MNRGDGAAGDAFRNVLQNFFTLLGGRAVGGLLALAATLLSARILGPAGFGIVALVHAYILLVRGVVSVKPFEAIVRFGIPLLEDGRTAEVGRLLRACLAIDAVCALAGFAVALAGAPLLVHFGVWDDDTATLASLYAATVLVSGQATASGALRIFDRFDAISRALVLGNGVRLAGVALASLAATPSVGAVAAAWGVSQIVQAAATAWYGWRVARARLGPGLLRGRYDPIGIEREHAGFWRFLNVVFWQSSLDLVPNPVGTLCAGALLGPDGAALFRIARELGNTVAKPALLARQAVYPDLMRLRHRADDGFRRVLVGVVLLLGVPALGVTLLTAWGGEAMLVLVLGAGYGPAGGLLAWLVAAATLELAASPLRPAAYSLGRAREILLVQVVASIVYLLLFVRLTPDAGLTGPGVAAIAMSALMLAGGALVVRQALRGERAPGR